MKIHTGTSSLKGFKILLLACQLLVLVISIAFRESQINSFDYTCQKYSSFYTESQIKESISLFKEHITGNALGPSLHGKSLLDKISPYLCGLFLEGIQDAVNELFLQLGVDVSCPQVSHDLLYRLHHHLPVLFRLILQVIHNTRDDLRRSYLVRDLYRRIYQLQIQSTD